MKNFSLRILLSTATLSTLTLTATTAIAGPVRLSSVKQVVSSNPNRSTGASAAQLVVGRGDDQPTGADADKPRVITEEESIIVEEEACACPDFGVGAFTAPAGGGFPWWTLGLGAVPLGFLAFNGDDNNSSATPTPFITPSASPGASPSPSSSPTATPVATPSPVATPTATPVATPTATPVATPTVIPSMPTPTPDAVPEPATILLFGTGLTGLGVVARRVLNKKRKDEEDNEKES